MSPKLPSDGFVCPHCGEPLPRNATFCRHCGSDDQTGWSNESQHATAWEDPEDLAEAYDEAFEREFGSGSTSPLEKIKSHRKRSGIPLWVMFVAILLASLFAWQMLRNVG